MVHPNVQTFGPMGHTPQTPVFAVRHRTMTHTERVKDFVLKNARELSHAVTRGGSDPKGDALAPHLGDAVGIPAIGRQYGNLRSSLRTEGFQTGMKKPFQILGAVDGVVDHPHALTAANDDACDASANTNTSS